MWGLSSFGMSRKQPSTYWKNAVIVLKDFRDTFSKFLSNWVGLAKHKDIKKKGTIYHWITTNTSIFFIYQKLFFQKSITHLLRHSTRTLPTIWWIELQEMVTKLCTIYNYDQCCHFYILAAFWWLFKLFVLI